MDQLFDCMTCFRKTNVIFNEYFISLQTTDAYLKKLNFFSFM